MAAGARAAANVAIGDTANALLVARASRGAAVALYAAKGSEVDTGRVDSCARAHGLVVVYPRVIEHARMLVFHAATVDALVPAPFGLREPRVDAPRVDVADIAVFVVPGLAFDRSGGRIGWGRGHYDATLAAASPSALRVGLAYDCQVVEQVAREAHDVALHILITEVATYTVV
jgi:5-formyltetrahydrofolate cyclo-ligase